MVKRFVGVRTNMYVKYRRYKAIWYICKDIVGKVRKGISYADYLYQGS